MHTNQKMEYHTTILMITIILLLGWASLGEAQTLAPAPSGPTNVTQILEKAGQFTTLIRLFSTTQVGPQINAQLNNSNSQQQSGLTVFAPTDNAFSALAAGTLNSLSDQQKVALIQFHILPTFLTMSQFQTVSNPLRTQAGDSAPGEFPMNVTTSGNQVNVSTGVDDATVANTVYTDGQLAVYQVDKVLLPMSLFGTPAPAAAPSGSVGKKPKAAGGPVAGGGNAPADSSGGTVMGVGFLAVLALAAICL